MPTRQKPATKSLRPLVRSAQRSLRDREQARSTAQLLLQPLAELLGWRLGERSKIATEEQEEEGGVPLLATDGDRSSRSGRLHRPGRPPRRRPARTAPPVFALAIFQPRAPRVGADLWRASERFRASTGLRRRLSSLVDRVRPHGDRRRDLPRPRYLETAPCPTETGFARRPSQGARPRP